MRSHARKKRSNWHAIGGRLNHTASVHEEKQNFYASMSIMQEMERTPNRVLCALRSFLCDISEINCGTL